MEYLESNCSNYIATARLEHILMAYGFKLLDEEMTESALL
jgi:hypothetical protein